MKYNRQIDDSFPKANDERDLLPKPMLPVMARLVSLLLERRRKIRKIVAFD